MAWAYLVLLLGLLTMGVWGTAKAQGGGLPDPTPEVRRQDSRQQELRRQLEQAPSVRLDTAVATPTRLLPSEEVCQVIHEVRVQAWPGPKPMLDAALAGPGERDPPQGRCLGRQAIAVLAERVHNALIAQGYLTSRIDVPTQELRSGQLLMQVVQGRIAHIRRAGPQTGRTLNTHPLTENGVLNLRDIEQSLENLRRNPGTEAAFELLPGPLPDTSDIVLRYSEPRALRGALQIDDSGSTATGKLMGQSSLILDSPLGLSDLAYFTLGRDLGQRAIGPRGNDSHSFHYSVPMGYWLLSFTASRSNYRQTVVGAFQNYLYSGDTDSRELQFTRVVHRNAESKTSLFFKSFSRRSSNYIDDTEVLVQRRRVGGWEAGV